jgi:hypothetical protein
MELTTTATATTILPAYAPRADTASALDGQPTYPSYDEIVARREARS